MVIPSRTPEEKLNQVLLGINYIISELTAIKKDRERLAHIELILGQRNPGGIDVSLNIKDPLIEVINSFTFSERKTVPNPNFQGHNSFAKQ